MTSSSSSSSSSVSDSKSKIKKSAKSPKVTATKKAAKKAATSSSSDSDDSSSSSSSASSSMAIAVDVDLSNSASSVKPATKDASKKGEEPTKTTLKDLFAPRGEDAEFSLLGHLDLDLDLDLDLELDFAKPEEQIQDTYEPTAPETHAFIPVRTTVLPFSQLPPDPKQPLFFPHPTSFPFANSTYVPHNKARDMFDVSRDKGWDPKLGVFINVNTGDEEYLNKFSSAKEKEKNNTSNPGWAMRAGKLSLQTNAGSGVYPMHEGTEDNANAVPLSLPLPPPGFFRTATAEGVRARWEAEKGARTQDWKRRCREAGKIGRRRGGGVDNE